MSNCSSACCTTVLWDAIHDEVKLHNPDLAKVLNSLKVKPALLKVKYCYGEEIVQDGKFRLPCECNECIQITNNIRDITPIPLGVVLKNSIEILEKSKNDHKTEPLRILQPGDLFGAFEVADLITGVSELPRWTLSAGARTIIPIWEMQNESVQEAIKKVFYSVGIAKSKFDSSKKKRSDWHENFWLAIKALARSVDKNWVVEVLIIAEDWHKLDRKQPLRAYLFETAWVQSRASRERGRIKRSESIDAILLKMLHVALGEDVGFTPSIQSSELGPFSAIQNKLFSALVEAAKKNKSGKLPPLPLLLLPYQLSERDSKKSNQPNFAYLSLENNFVPAYEIDKPSSSAYLKANTGKRDELITNHSLSDKVEIGFIIADSSDRNLVETEVVLRSAYVDRYFGSDFAEQLKLAQDVGWVKEGSGDYFKEALFAKNSGFLVAFARVVKKAEAYAKN
jgi:hypothetical protein